MKGISLREVLINGLDWKCFCFVYVVPYREGGGGGGRTWRFQLYYCFQIFFSFFLFLLRRPPSHGHSFLNFIFSILCSEKKNKQSFELNQKLLTVLNYEHFYALNSCFSSSRFLLLLEM